jgi:hypothetical protein
MEDRPSNSSRFQPGHEKTGGRQPGVRNRTTRLLKEAIIMAAELEGSDGEGKDGLVGFLRRVANTDIRAFASLLGRVIPLQVETKGDELTEVAYQSVAEVRAELEQSGITFELVKQIFHDDDDLRTTSADANGNANVLRLPRGDMN